MRIGIKATNAAITTQIVDLDTGKPENNKHMGEKYLCRVLDSESPNPSTLMDFINDALSRSDDIELIECSECGKPCFVQYVSMCQSCLTEQLYPS